MVQHFTDEELRELIETLRSLPRETEWVEFKENNADSQRIGKYVSGLANTAALMNKPCGYLVWGIEDVTHDVVGTTFNPESVTVEGSELGFWLSRHTRGEVHFTFAQTDIDGKHMVVLTVDAARSRPVEFKGSQQVRIKSSLTDLKSYADHERRLWDILRSESFETGVAYDGASGDQIARLLDLDVYFHRSRTPMPESNAEILDYAQGLKLIQARADGKWQITNLGALLFAKDLSQFPSLDRRVIRVVQYAGTDRLNSLRRQDGQRGYAVGFTGLLTWIKALLPAGETYVDGERVATSVYSDLLLREVIANALIHQDFLAPGNGPSIDIFADRIEIINAGTPLMAADRMINHPPISRNDLLGKLMRQMKLCEESGTGWDKIANEAEVAGLPSPKIELEEHATRVIVYGPRKLTAMDRADKVRAVYFHACLRWAKGQHLTNASLRARFGISANNSSQVSRLLADAIAQGQIALFDDTVGHKSKSYVPYWVLQPSELV